MRPVVTDDTIDILAPFVSDARKAKIEAVLAQRLGGLTVVLENHHDPHNGAAALRSVEGFGLTTLHVVEQTEPFRFSSRVSQGCEKWVDIRRHADFDACARGLRAAGFALYAALPPAAATVELDAIDVGRPTALVFGNEHAGLTPAALAACDGAFTIPMQGFTASFNLSVSVALGVFACSRRRRAALGGRGDLDGDALVRERARWYALSVDAAELILARVRGDTQGRG
jgi:tRNA (guanosine-2'-O-)-methyltransferase